MEYNNKYLNIHYQIGGWTVQEYIKDSNYIDIIDMPRNTTLEHLKLFLIDRKFRFDDITQISNKFTVHFSSPEMASKSRFQLIKVLAGKHLGLSPYNPNYVKPNLKLPLSVKPNLKLPSSVKPNLELPSSVKPKLEHPLSVEPKLELPSSVKPKLEHPLSVEPKLELPLSVEPKLELPSSVKPIVELSSSGKSGKSVKSSSSVEEKKLTDNKSEKITIIENGLREFGLKKISLDGNDSIDNYFDKIIKDLDNLSDYIDEFIPFKDGYTLKHKGLYGSYYEKNYILGRSSGSGSWNKTFTCKDEKGREFIIKQTNTSDTDSEKLSFYENIKHLILYILIRKYIGKLKFIPQMYHLGILKESKDKISIICIMEKGGVLLGDYINTVSFIDNQKLFLKIYNSLFIIEDKLKINFKHNDFKENNILVSSDGKPMLIDFGFCEFKIETINFYSLYASHENFDRTTHFGYNIIHDMMQLITSLYNSPGAVICPYRIFKFIKNTNTNILDTNMLISYLNIKFPPIYKDREGRFNKTFNLEERINHLRPDELAYLKKMFLTFYDKGKYDLIYDKLNNPFLQDISIFITPTELADNIGIPLPSEDESFGSFEKKYKKYKMKYLELKKAYNFEI